MLHQLFTAILIAKNLFQITDEKKVYTLRKMSKILILNREAWIRGVIITLKKCVSLVEGYTKVAHWLHMVYTKFLNEISNKITQRLHGIARGCMGYTCNVPVLTPRVNAKKQVAKAADILGTNL